MSPRQAASLDFLVARTTMPASSPSKDLPSLSLERFVLIGTVRIASLISEVHTNGSKVHFCLIEPGGISTNFAGTSLVRSAPHPSYSTPDTPARLLEGYILNVDNHKTWSSPQSVAAAMYEVVSRGQRIPIRVPLGPDAWGLIKDEIKQVDKDLDELRYLSESVGNAKQFDSIHFIRKDK